MTRVFGVQRRVVRALRPVLSRAAGVPMPEDSVFDAVERLHADLEQVQQILTEKDATVRLVLTPETVVVAEARRSLTTLSLYGYRVDGVIANRVFPEGGGDAWREGWVAAQQTVLAEVRQSFADLPIWRSGYRAERADGGRRRSRTSPRRRTTGHDPLAVPESGEGPMTITRTDTGAVLRIALPFAAAAGRRPRPAR